MVVMVVKIRHDLSQRGQFIIIYTCKPHINHKYSLVIITPLIFSSIKCCISADEKDHDSIFTTVTTIWKPLALKRPFFRSIFP